MTDNATLEFAIANGLSNKQAKRQRRSRPRPDLRVARGIPVAGTGKPKGPEKG